MATSKKGKKSKGVTLSFQEFTAKLDGDSQPSGQNMVYAPPKKNLNPAMSSWADEVEEDEMITAKERIFLPTAPRASRGPAYDDAQIPRSPPFQANLGNLHYDIEEEDIYKFFKDLDVAELKLPRDQQTNRIKGFGFVIFETRTDLIEALTMSDQMLRGRPVRVALLSGDGRSDSRRSDSRPMRPPAEDEGVDNWRSMMGSNRGPMTATEDRPRRNYDNNYQSNRDRFRRNSSENEVNEEETWRRPQQQREQFYQPRGDNFQRENYGGSHRDGFRGDYQREEYHGERDRGFQGDRDREGRREREPSPDFIRPQIQPRPEREPRREPPQQIERERTEREPRTDRDTTRERTEPRADPQPPQSPKQRKKLILQPRTAPIATTTEETTRPSSIFGEAKPVDTLKREQEIEQKQQQPMRLLTRDGSERILPWRMNRERRPPSQSSVEKQDDKDSHSEPEDERDFKLQQMSESEGRGGNRRFPRPAYNNRGDRDRDPRPDRRDNYSRDYRGMTRRAQNPPRLFNQRARPVSGRIVDKDGFELSTTTPTQKSTRFSSPQQPPNDEEAVEIVSNKFAALGGSDED